MNCSSENYHNPYGYNAMIPKNHSLETHSLVSVSNNGSLSGYCQGKQLVSPNNLSDLSKCNPECVKNCQQYCLKSNGGHLNSAADCTSNCSDFCLDHHQSPITSDNGAEAAENCGNKTNSQGCGDVKGCCQTECKGDSDCISGCMNKLVNCCSYPSCRFSKYCKNCSESSDKPQPSPGGGGGSTPKPPSPGGNDNGEDNGNTTQKSSGFWDSKGGKITVWVGIGILVILAILAVITTIMKHNKKSRMGMIGYY